MHNTLVLAPWFDTSTALKIMHTVKIFLYKEKTLLTRTCHFVDTGFRCCGYRSLKKLVNSNITEPILFSNMTFYESLGK